MNIEVGKEVPHVDYCGFLYAEENMSSSSEEAFEDSNEPTEPMQSNEIKLYDTNSTSEDTGDLGFLDWSDSELSLELSITALANNLNRPHQEGISYAEKIEGRSRVRYEKGIEFIKSRKMFNDSREKELLHKLLTQKSETQTQTEDFQKETDQKYTFMRVVMVVFMIVLSVIIVKDYGSSTGLSITNYLSKCCLCVFMSSTINYFASFLNR